MSFLSSPPLAVAAALSIFVSGNMIRTSGVRADVAVAPQTAEDPNIRCAATRATSVAIPFERIYPHAERVKPDGYYVFVRGPRILAVISDSTMWPAVWHGAVDSVTTAPVVFGDGVLVLAATQTVPMGPIELRIVSIRQCRRTGVIVVSTLETRARGAGIPMIDRAIDLVRVPGRTLVEHTVLFDQRFRLVP